MNEKRKKNPTERRVRKRSSVLRQHKRSVIVITAILILLTGTLSVNAVGLYRKNKVYKQQEAELKAQIAKAEDGDTLEMSATGLPWFPSSVARALKGKDVTLEIRKNGVTYTPPRRESDQVSLTALGEAEVLDALRRCQPDTLTPIEAMSLLYELKQKLS